MERHKRQSLIANQEPTAQFIRRQAKSGRGTQALAGRTILNLRVQVLSEKIKEKQTNGFYSARRSRVGSCQSPAHIARCRLPRGRARQPPHTKRRRRGFGQSHLDWHTMRAGYRYFRRCAS